MQCAHVGSQGHAKAISCSKIKTKIASLFPAKHCAACGCQAWLSSSPELLLFCGEALLTQGLQANPYLV